MDIQEAKEEIRNTVLAYTAKNPDGSYRIPSVRQRPVLLIGPPGIGKTAIMEQISKELGIGLVAYTITHHTRQSAIGLPVIREREFDGKLTQVTEYTMSEIIASVYQEIERTGRREGILFIDEINCVSETLAPAMLEFLQCKRFGSHQVPGGWVICAAGNPPGYNRSVREFDVVTLDRVRLLNVEENLEVFKTFALQAGIHPAIMAFLQLKPQNFYRMENQEKGTWFVTARGWEDLSDSLKVYETLGIPITQAFVEEFLQFPMIASEFYAFYGLFGQYEKKYEPGYLLAHARADAGRMEELITMLDAAGREEKISFIYLSYLEIVSGKEKQENSENKDKKDKKDKKDNKDNKDNKGSTDNIDNIDNAETNALSAQDKIELAFEILKEQPEMKQLLLKLILTDKDLALKAAQERKTNLAREIEDYEAANRSQEYEELTSKLYGFLNP